MKEQNFDSKTIEHLRMLQNIINRIASTSLGIKRYSLMLFTFSSSYLVIAPNENKLSLFYLAVFLLLSMLFYDMYYLSMERAYRIKFNQDRQRIEETVLFDLAISKISLNMYMSTFASKSIYLFYLPLFIVMISLHVLI